MPCSDFRSSCDEKKLTYSKLVNAEELLLNQLAERKGICPEIISVEPYHGKVWNYGINNSGVVEVTPSNRIYMTDEHYIMTSRLYPKTIYQHFRMFSNREWVFAEVKKKVKLLHEIGILHCDLTQQNIVVHPKYYDVRIIDFGNSCFIDRQRCSN
jgi:tRNA A-37 threonylcarbamoyl transferase component Bud32